MSYTAIALFMFSLMLILICTGRHFSFVIGGIASFFAIFLWGKGALDLTYFSTYGITNWLNVVAVPMFILMGFALSRSGATEKTYNAVRLLMGRIHGGLGIATIALCSVIAAISGGCEAATVAAGTIALPEMLKRGYDKRMAVGLAMASGSLGFLIPPSIVFIFYGIIARVSIGRLWAAGAIPGLLLASMYAAYIAIKCAKNPKLGPGLKKEELASWKEKITAMNSGLPPVLLIFFVLGFLVLGVTTLTECSAIGALGALIIMALNKKFNKKLLFEILDDTTKTTTMVMWILISSILFGAVFNGLNAIDAVAKLLMSISGGNKWIPIIVIQLSFLFLGTCLDDTALLIIVAPLYIPIVKSLGFDLVWFGVLYVLNMQMAFLTPPFGYTLFVMKAVAPKEIKITDIYLSIIPYLFIQALCILLVMIFPNIALWLPNVLFPK